MFVLLAVLLGALSALQIAPAPPDAAVIVNSGSTNTAGYRIIVQSNGSVRYALTTTDAAASKAPLAERKLDGKTLRPLFAELSAIGSVDKLAPGTCMKSVSFGTRTYVQWHGASTPDLSCASNDARVARLYQKVKAVEGRLGFPAAAGRKFRRAL